VAPEVGFEPTTNRLTADRSTTELLWIGKSVDRRGVYVAQATCVGKERFRPRLERVSPHLANRRVSIGIESRLQRRLMAIASLALPQAGAEPRLWRLKTKHACWLAFSLGNLSANGASSCLAWGNAPGIVSPQMAALKARFKRARLPTRKEIWMQGRGFEPAVPQGGIMSEKGR
jgi:hypothetical protein